MENYYVYVYIDPRNYEEFYYGKGKWNRKEDHLKSSDDNEKTKIIKEIQNEGLEPIIKVIARGLTEHDAFLVEKTLIWKLGKSLTNISAGYFADKFRPHNKLHLNLSGFDYEKGIYFINVGEGKHRCWEDCLTYSFISSGGAKKYSDPFRKLEIGDVVAAYLNKHGYIGIGKVIEKAVPINEFRVDHKPLNDYPLKEPNIFQNSVGENSEFVVRINWLKTVDRNSLKERKQPKHFISRLVKASLDNQPETIRFLEKEFEIDLHELLVNSNYADPIISAIIKPMELEISKNNYIGCILGGAIGDALGAPIEFLSYEQIQSKYGKAGVTDYVEHENGNGEFTDDTQMTLFTAEGLLRAWHRSVLKGIGGAQTAITFQSYLRWLYTQGVKVNITNVNNGVYDIEHGWLLKRKELFVRREPGNTCISALQSGIAGSIELPINESKGCGTVMRIAPVGLVYKHDREIAFREAVYISALTHGHPSGYLSGGFLASVIADLANRVDIQSAIFNAKNILISWENHSEVLRVIDLALELHENYKNKDLTNKEIEKIGSGWTAEEALAISLLCALHYQHNFEKGVLLSVNHSGDSDSTGAITGNILGLILGTDCIPPKWKEKLLYHDIVEEMGLDLFIGCKSYTNDIDHEWLEKYPEF